MKKKKKNHRENRRGGGRAVGSGLTSARELSRPGTTESKRPQFVKPDCTRKKGYQIGRNTGTQGRGGKGKSPRADSDTRACGPGEYHDWGHKEEGSALEARVVGRVPKRKSERKGGTRMRSGSIKVGGKRITETIRKTFEWGTR